MRKPSISNHLHSAEASQSRKRLKIAALTSRNTHSRPPPVIGLGLRRLYFEDLERHHRSSRVSQGRSCWHLVLEETPEIPSRAAGPTALLVNRGTNFDRGG
jgi:hypothetical protein